MVLPADNELYRQGEAADNLYYLDSGAVTIGVASGGKDPIVVSVYGPGTFFGARSLRQEAHNSTATALLTSTLIRVSKMEVQSLLRTDPTFARDFAMHMLQRAAVLEEEQIDRVVNSTDKRLARILLILGSLDVESQGRRIMARITEAKLARMLAADPLCIRKLVQKFRRAGHLGPGEPLTVHSSLANVLLTA